MHHMACTKSLSMHQDAACRQPAGPYNPSSPPAPSLPDVHMMTVHRAAAPCSDILAIPETRADWWQLFKQHLAAPLEAGAIKLSIINSDMLGGS